jgi:CubicO group peptidase (beta-lactamase class C family)
MKYMKALNIIFLFLLLFSCKNKENETENKIVNEEITHPEIESLINNMISEEHFTGVVLVAVNDEIIHAKGYGIAQDGIQNRINTKFHVASITKQFTAAAIMQLLEQKKINLEESINEYLPTQYRSDKWNNVTIHHLLTQTSGIEDYGLTRNYYEVEKGFCLGNTVDGMIKEAMAKELKFPSGSKFSYSNIGYTLLGQIIENTSGEPYDSYMKKHIFEPMGMHNSFIHNTSNYTVANDEAIGYRWDDELNKHVPDDIVSLPVTQPDGNLVTTVADFLKWSNVYVNNNQKAINEVSIKKMTFPYIENDFSFRANQSPKYGYGLSLTDGVISHPGYIVGFRSHFIVDTNNDIRVFVFNNNVSNNPKNVSGGIYDILSEKHIDKNNDL